MFEVTHIKAIGLQDAWAQCLREALDNGRLYKIDSGSFEGTHRKEIPMVSIHITFPGIRPLCPLLPPEVPAPASAEGIEEYFAEYLMSGEVRPNEQYTYGQDIVYQVDEVIRRFKEGYDTNQCCMSVGSKESLFLKDPQCLRLIDCRIQDGTLHLIVYFRSWDLWGGLPTNLGGIQLLKEYIAESIGVADGSIVAFSKGLHIYEHCWDLAKIVLKETTKNESP